MGLFDLKPHQIPLVGPLLFRNKANEAQVGQLRRAGQTAQAYRPEVAQARLNALRQTTGLMQPLNDLMAESWGAGAQMPFQDSYANPFGPSAMSIGGTGGGPPPPALQQAFGLRVPFNSAISDAAQQAPPKSPPASSPAMMRRGYFRG